MTLSLGAWRAALPALWAADLLLFFAPRDRERTRKRRQLVVWVGSRGGMCVGVASSVVATLALSLAGLIDWNGLAWPACAPDVFGCSCLAVGRVWLGSPHHSLNIDASGRKRENSHHRQPHRKGLAFDWPVQRVCSKRQGSDDADAKRDAPSSPNIDRSWAMSHGSACLSSVVPCKGHLHD
jgi:hypothetical protein